MHIPVIVCVNVFCSASIQLFDMINHYSIRYMIISMENLMFSVKLNNLLCNRNLSCCLVRIFFLLSYSRFGIPYKINVFHNKWEKEKVYTSN